MYQPEEVKKKEEVKIKEKGFDYYKRHIHLENYDEEPESRGEITKQIEEIKKKFDRRLIQCVVLVSTPSNIGCVQKWNNFVVCF